MKRSLLIFAVLMLFGWTAAVAQQRDTTATQQQVPEGMVEIQASEVPAPVQEALRSANYTGWEQGTFYRNENSDLYLVEIGEGADAKHYYFDKNGTPTMAPRQEE
ncbi:MAG TPA: hypothetical protein VIL31_11035 [Cyclobacteriaceae bacterium]|jgi:hypothetical protein|nr:MAG: hypothetical protein DIU61_13295 [Bacteroidota bacterium]